MHVPRSCPSHRSLMTRLRTTCSVARVPPPEPPLPPPSSGGRPHTCVPRQTPALHTSSSEHSSPSSHDTPSRFAVWQPDAGSHESAVQALPSSHTTGWPWHVPAPQASCCVQALPSSQTTPVSSVGSDTHSPVRSSQRSAVQPLPSSHETEGPGTQAPSLHAPLPVQSRPSSHVCPPGSNWHDGEQQSPDSALPSSHCSPGSMLPLPQWRIWRSTMSIALCAVLLHTTAVPPSDVVASAGMACDAAAAEGVLRMVGRSSARPSTVRRWPTIRLSCSQTTSRTPGPAMATAGLFAALATAVSSIRGVGKTAPPLSKRCRNTRPTPETGAAQVRNTLLSLATRRGPRPWNATSTAATSTGSRVKGNPLA